MRTTFKQFQEYHKDVGMKFAIRMALSTGVSIAQIHLWVIRIEQNLIKQEMGLQNG